jgi:hypothetical protein
MSFKRSVSDLIFKRKLWDGKKVVNFSPEYQDALHALLQNHFYGCIQIRGFPFPPRFICGDCGYPAVFEFQDETWNTAQEFQQQCISLTR